MDNDDSEELEGLLVADINIQMRLTDEGQRIWFRAVDAGGETLPLVQSLGMLRMSEDTAIRMAMGDDGPDDEEF